MTNEALLYGGLVMAVCMILIGLRKPPRGGMLAFGLVVCVMGIPITASAQTTLLDFTAEWCGPCRQMAPVVAQLEAAGYSVRRVDIDREPALAKQYGVSAIPCFVALVDGREVGRRTGAASLADLQQLSRRPAGNALPATQTGSQPYHRAVVRVTAGSFGGSGTLIAVDPATNEGIVLTCAHVTEGGAPYRVSYPAAGSSSAVLIAEDRQLDVAALWVKVPEGIEPIPVADGPSPKGAPIELCGYGGGQWKALPGSVLGYTRHMTGKITDVGVTPLSISGDSGGAILTTHGGRPALLAVLWGGPLRSNQGPMIATHGVYCMPLRDWLHRVVCPRYPYCLPQRPQQPPQGRYPPQTAIPPGDDYAAPQEDYLPPEGQGRPPIAAHKPCECDHDAILASIKANTEQIAALTAIVKANVGKPGPKGERGERGPQGPAGPALDLDLDELADAVAAKIKFSVVFEDGNGSDHSRQIVGAGGELRIPPSRLNIITPSGEIQATGKPLGEPLRIQLENIPVQAP